MLLFIHGLLASATPSSGLLSPVGLSLFEDSMKLISLTQGKFAKVSDQDYKWLSQWKWTYCKGKHDTQGYATRHIQAATPAKIFMHLVIKPPPKGMQTDHRDRDTLNNCRNNLRHATSANNAHNRRKITRPTTSQYKGVEYYPSNYNKHWRPRIRVNGKLLSFGLYEKEIDAARAYDKAAKKHFGRFAYLNFP